MGQNDLSSTLLESLLSSVAMSKSITALNLGSSEKVGKNKFSKASTPALCRMLSLNPLISQLELEGTCLMNQGLQMLASGLPENSSLLTLDISHNELTHKCVPSL